MKKYKVGKILGTIVLSAALLLTSGICTGLEVSAAAQKLQSIVSADGQYTYEVWAGTATLIEYHGTAAEVVVPDTIDGFPVQGLRETFEGNAAITSVTIPAGITAISDTVFKGCKSIQSFTVVPENPNFANDAEGVLYSKDLTTLYRYPVGKHQPSGTYTIPATVVNVYGYAFEGYSTPGIVIPGNVKTIGDYAFANTGNFNGVTTWEEGTTLIGTYAFYGCTNLRVTLPSTVNTIGVYAFANCKNIQIDISKCALTEIADYLFYDCDNLHELTLPATVTRVGAYAFHNCNNLNEVKFPAGLKQIAEGAFKGCANLHTVEVPEGVTAIENKTFEGCQNLNKVVLPSTLTKIGDNAFAGCRNIHQINIPEGVKYISNSSFNGVDMTKIGLKVSVKATKLKSAKKSGKKVKLTWKKVKDATGYVIYRSTKKNKGYKRIKTIKGNKKFTYKDGKKLKKKKTYYYKIKVCRKLSGKTYYSKYSNMKKVKIKK